VQEHAEEMERLQGLHAEETQKVLLEFTKAQTILKEKIDELSSLYVLVNLHFLFSSLICVQIYQYGTCVERLVKSKTIIRKH